MFDRFCNTPKKFMTLYLKLELKDLPQYFKG